LRERPVARAVGTKGFEGGGEFGRNFRGESGAGQKREKQKKSHQAVMPEPGVKSTHIAARRDAGAAGTMPLNAFFLRLGICGKVDAAFRTARDGFRRR
jgi:hypothetical protein